MVVRRLETVEERLLGERLIADAFMHPFDEDEVRRATPVPGADVLFGAFDDAGALVAATSTCRHRLAFGGHEVAAGELHMVGSNVESRGRGNVRSLVRQALEAFRKRGDLFAILIPFSYPYYRQFGFESCARTLTQRVATSELSCFACDMEVRRVLTEADVRRVRALWEAFAMSRNLCDLLGDGHWALTAYGEWSERDFLHPDCVRYSYILVDADGRDRAFMTVMLVTEPHNPFVGVLHVTEVAYDGLEALGAVLGLCHRLRAKADSVEIELADDIDLAAIVANPDAVTRTVGGHAMARVLDVPRALLLMDYPEGAGAFTIAVDDPFLEGAGGTFAVRWRDGRAVSVEPHGGTADLAVPIQTFTQLVTGASTLDEALLRPGTRLAAPTAQAAQAAQADALRRAFCRRLVCLSL